MLNGLKGFGKPPRQVQKPDCQIRIKNGAQGKTISFSGNCSKEQLEMAKYMNGADEIEEEE